MCGISSFNSVSVGNVDVSTNKNVVSVVVVVTKAIGIGGACGGVIILLAPLPLLLDSTSRISLS